jgi:hypothetical protein
VTGIPSKLEIDGFGLLSNLRHLTIHGAERVADLVRLRPILGALEVLDVHGVPWRDRAAARAAIGDAQPGLDVRVHPA